jgi:AcrR family transcriptional regulator
LPTPRRTSVEQIVLAGRGILEEEGLESLTMQRVAQAVGVRAPSLYKHVRDRGDLIRLIGNDAARELGRRIDQAAGTGDPPEALRAMAYEFRAFAHADPQAYRLLFARLPEDWRADPALLAGAIEAVMDVIGRLVGREHTLEAARTFVAWAHGFVSMELAGAFRLGGDVDAAFAYGVDRLIAGFERTGSAVGSPADGPRNEAA